MQDIRWKALWLGLATVFACLIIWAATDAITALLAFCAIVLLYLASHLYWLHKLLQWFKKPELNAMPVGSGIWEDVFSAIYYEKRRHSRSQAQISSALDRFRHAASALPDGVVLLNGNDQIEWCNPTAERQLGLSIRQDTGHPISYLVRPADFIQYLQRQDYSEPIKLKSWRVSGATLEIQLVPFGANQKLLISRDISQMEKLETMRRDFIANVSHELRTPLTVVGGFIETLTDMEGAVPESTRGYFGMMQEQTGRMRRLIEDLLTLSQLENSPEAPQETENDLSTLLNMLLHEGISLSQGEHDITLEPVEPGLFIKGAAEELHSALGNLVSNAVRYTPEGGKINLKLFLRGTEVLFSVRDTGIGIEQQHIDRLTERFYRVDRSRSRETGGTGLGLSIVKHILTRHQGYLEIESEAGKGSIFSAVLPQSRLVRKTPQQAGINA
ncbi:phosphate regulon sensor histidine kinase PhoR [Methylobacillus arboreus]|uniref:phosphate regulon sensor histidine kinase PhoR n=1 Tax=Methylobacillus arboreus TaxID=755170 RepID=UPI001E5CD6E6|nr:phosphate regulon sensor histidine kinase PhoR [Methylobacillus arboreus]MCB5191286.1 phosphate regulon sensor histidine kinase PhoR [Methylobacillus arboreus]